MHRLYDENRNVAFIVYTNKEKMGSREEILSRIKKGVAPVVALPDMSVTNKWSGNIDMQILQDTIESVGGEMHFLNSVLDVDEKLKDLFPDVKMSYSNVKGVSFGNVELTGNLTAHDLAKLELAVLPGQFVVEENGSVFISNESMGNKMIPTITEYLVLVVPRSEVVKNMHEAYKIINLKNMEYGVFISGPSKTADIESTLVFGAHGAKNLAVFLVDE
jgi:L-lactate dehydrogenase complex protein LldG